MCGIAGIIHYSNPINPQLIQNMTETPHARGPDATGYWNDTHCSFGHKRLIVVDPSGGVQPFSWGSYHF